MEWITSILDWIGVAGGIVGVFSFLLALHEWRKVNRKLAMLGDASRAAEILPAWYISRMMQDHWCFGLLMRDGRTIAITRIIAISDDGRWMDVELAQRDDVNNVATEYRPIITAIADDRLAASLQISMIVAAVDMRSS